jgi:HlyD family secretion protein
MTKKKSNKVIYILSGLFVLLIAVIVAGNMLGWIGGTKEIEVEVGEARRETIVDKVTASGMIQPVYEVKISPDVSGEIIELHVEEGDSVQRGELLLKIRPDIYQSSLERARANLSQQQANLASARAAATRAEAQLIRAEAEYNRNKQLREEKVISQSDFELAEANYKIAVSDLQSARQSVVAAEYIVESSRATVREAEENLRFTIITAPVTGIVSKLNVEMGERVVGTAQMAGTEMLRIADLSKMEARVDVNENDIIRVSLADTAIIDVDAYTYTEETFKGVVTNIANTANDKLSPDAVTEFEVRILILNESYRELQEEQSSATPFRPGMTASVDIIVDVKEDVLSVPLASVTTRNPDQKDEEENGGDGQSTGSGENRDGATQENDMEVVFLFQDGKAVMAEVETGISDFDNIEIVGGISEGQEVITGPFMAVSKRLDDGDAVKIIEEDEKKGKDRQD